MITVRESETHFFFYRHEFGQWTKRVITDRHGLTYNCCEQYMMFQKAMLFRDEVTAEKIMTEPNPRLQQRYGREVRDFSIPVWEQHRFQIVLEGNLYKFNQHQDLQALLLATGDKVLVEGSPVDRIWGVGLGCDDDEILDPSNWKGQNLLGKVLMSVRFSLLLSRT